MIVAAPRHFPERFATVQRLEEAAVSDVDFVVISGGDGDANVVPGAPDQLPLEIHCLPVFTAVVGPPQRPLLLGLDQCKKTLRICRRNRNVNFSYGSFRQSVALELGPFGPAVF